MTTAATIINLTRPISTETPAGTLLPWEAPYRTEDIVTLQTNGANLFHITMGSGSATRLLGPGLVSPEGQMTDQLAPASVTNREAVLARVEPEPGGAVTADQISAAVATAQPRPGDALLLATGWGDTDEWRHDPRYYLRTPYLTVAAAEALGDLLAGHGVPLLLTDCAYLDQPAHTSAHAQWTELVPWLRPPWPSDAARTYLDHYRPDQVRRDWAATVALVERVWTVVGLVGCGQLPAARARLTVAPLPIQGVGEAPCTVVAEPLAPATTS